MDELGKTAFAFLFIVAAVIIGMWSVELIKLNAPANAPAVMTA